MKREVMIAFLGILLVCFAFAESNITLEGNDSTSSAALNSPPRNNYRDGLSMPDNETLRGHREELRVARSNLEERRLELNKQLRNLNLTDEERAAIRLRLGELSKENLTSRQNIKKEVRQHVRERLAEGEEIEVVGVKMRKAKGQILEMRLKNNASIRTRLNLSDNETLGELRAQLSNGRNATIKVMPETASERALERLRLKNCNESKNCSIELKEVGNKLVYEARARKTYRILWMFKNREDVATQIDAETGEVIEETKRPWWAWMASESEEADELDE